MFDLDPSLKRAVAHFTHEFTKAIYRRIKEDDSNRANTIRRKSHKVPFVPTAEPSTRSRDFLYDLIIVSATVDLLLSPMADEITVGQAPYKLYPSSLWRLAYTLTAIETGLTYFDINKMKMVYGAFHKKTGEWAPPTLEERLAVARDFATETGIIHAFDERKILDDVLAAILNGSNGGAIETALLRASDPDAVQFMGNPHAPNGETDFELLLDGHLRSQRN